MDILICEMLNGRESACHTCNHNYGFFEWFPCNQTAVAWVGWETELTRKWPQWKYTNLFGHYMCLGHTNLIRNWAELYNYEMSGDWAEFPLAPELASLCRRVADAYNLRFYSKSKILILD